MARPLRLEFEGAIYHLLGRGNARQRIFASGRDRIEFLKLLAASAERFEGLVHGFALMVPAEALVGRVGYGMEARNVAMALVWEHCALRLREIGELFGGMDYAAVAQRIRRVKQANPARLRKLLKQMSNV